MGVGEGGLAKEGNYVPYSNEIGLQLNPLNYRKKKKKTLSLPKICFGKPLIYSMEQNTMKNIKPLLYACAILDAKDTKTH